MKKVTRSRIRRLRRLRRIRRLLTALLTAGIVALLAWSSGCASTPPDQVEDLCQIFDEKGGWFDNWHKAAKRSSQKYGVSVPVLMATIHQESRFQPKARPPRTRLLWVIPWKRPSTAYGFAQALDPTWENYMRNTNRQGADRDKFKDAVDFVGWYHLTTHRRNGVRRDDTYHLYLAYHTGHGGFARKAYADKAWLQRVARKVQTRAQLYDSQYRSCSG